MFLYYPYHLHSSSKEQIIKDIGYLFDTGNWCHQLEIPKYQTWPNLFDIDTIYWKNFKGNFIEAVNSLYGKTNFKIKCWCYKSFPYVPSQYNENCWHNHLLYDNSGIATGIYYIQMPTNCNGTEYKYNDEISIIPSKEHHWTFFPVSLEHRPGYWQHDQMFQSRIVITAVAHL